MGTALQNLEMLLQMPFGCGEQNMVKFVPNIFILQYLERTNQATPEIRTKATEYMQSGESCRLLGPGAVLLRQELASVAEKGPWRPPDLLGLELHLAGQGVRGRAYTGRCRLGFHDAREEG